MIDEKINRVKTLIQQREAIDAELSAIFGITTSKRGRPRKDAGGTGDAQVLQDRSASVGVASPTE
jgi:hypothetical protein